MWETWKFLKGHLVIHRFEEDMFLLGIDLRRTGVYVDLGYIGVALVFKR